MTDVLFFVEDPGAANYVTPLPAALEKLGLSSQIVATGHAVSFLTQRGETFQSVGDRLNAAAFLADKKPSVLVIGTSENPQTAAFDLVVAGRASCIPVVGIVDGPANAAFRFRGRTDNPLAYAPDIILVADSLTRSGLMDLGMAAERIVLCGHPQFDRLRALARTLSERDRAQLQNTVLPKKAPGAKVVTFVAEQQDGVDPDEHLRGSDYTLQGRATSARRVDIVIEEFLDAIATFPERPYMVLRLHPKNVEGDFAPYLKDFDHVSKGEPAHDLVWSSDLVVGLTSILLVEAVLLGAATLSIVPREGERLWLSTAVSGMTPCVWTRAALRIELARVMERSGGKELDRVSDEFPLNCAQQAAIAIRSLVGNVPSAL